AFHRPDGEVIDLAATDILRVRERGVPRYQRFREFFHLRPITSFEELCDQPEWVEELRRVYNDDLDAVDLMIGSFAEPKPRGFGFSDTAFRVFVLMASRRLEADRFFTVDYRPEVYTPAGFEWIDDNTMKSVLLRHFPELEAALQGVENAFAPWNGGTA
ncbi:MAG: peroxidase family protein, partial [Gaiellaceae bacterium]